MGKYEFAFFYFIFATGYGYIVLKDEPWFPYYLGGKNESFIDMFIDAPFVPVTKGAITYAMLQIGYHGGDMIMLTLLEERQSDYFEMLMHHICAVSLLVSMVYANGMTIGCTISFLHDIADITVAITKFWGLTKYATLAALGLLANMVVWGYTRMIVLPYMIYNVFIFV